MTASRVLVVLALLVARPLLATPTVGTDIGDRVPAFKAEATDVSGKDAKPRAFDSQAQKKITTYLFLGTQCPATAAYLDRIRALDEKYHAKGVEFVYVYPNKTDTSEAKTDFHKKAKLPGPMIDDTGGQIARALGAQHTSETLLVAKDGRLLYRGAIDDSRDPAGVHTTYLATALDQALAGKPIATTTTDVQA